MKPLKILSYNIDTNMVRVDGGKKMSYAGETHEAWRANNRASSIQATIRQLLDDKGKADIIHIQECRKFINEDGDAVDSLTPLNTFLQERGYQVQVTPYNKAGGDRAFQYITAFRPERLELQDGSLKLFTQTPDESTPRPSDSKPTDEEFAAIKGHNFGAFWERGVFINHLRDRVSGETVISMNAHLDITRESRVKSSELLGKFAKEVLEQEPNAKIVLTGDFNSLPGAGDEDQIRLVLSENFQDAPIFAEATSGSVFPDKTEAKDTFFPFPYDAITQRYNGKPADRAKELEATRDIEQRRDNIDSFYKQQCLSATGFLDRAFLHGLVSTSCMVCPVPLYPGLFNGYEAEQVKNYVVAVNEQYHQPAFASDHQPVWLEACSATGLQTDKTIGVLE